MVEVCQQIDGGWLCTLLDGHDGPHEAWGVSKCYRVWERTTPSPATAPLPEPRIIEGMGMQIEVPEHQCGETLSEPLTSPDAPFPEVVFGCTLDRHHDGDHEAWGHERCWRRWS